MRPENFGSSFPCFRSKSARMGKGKFEAGDLIFGKVKGYPPWPARVTALSSKDRWAAAGAPCQLVTTQ